MRMIRTIFPAWLILLFACLLLPAHAGAQEPDFSDTDDILNGQRNMLRADDLALVYQDVAPASPYTNTVYTNLLLTQNSQLQKAQFFTATAPSGVALPGTQVQVALGRMFDQATDITAVAAVEANVPNDGGVSLFATFFDAANNRTQRILLASANPANGGSATPLSVLMGDFTGDGFEEFVVSIGVSNGENTGATFIITAVDPQNWSAGFKLGPPFIYSFGPVPGFADMAVADVDGDGQNEIAAAINNPLGPAFGPQLVVLGVDPATLNITTLGATNVGSGTQPIQVVSGDWDADSTDDEVMFVAAASGAAGGTVVQLYDFTLPAYTAVLTDQVQAPGTATEGVLAAGGRVEWLGGDAVVVATQGSNSYDITVYLASNGSIQQAATYSDSANGELLAMALGRFDNRNANGSVDPDLQLAAVLQAAAGSSFAHQLVVYDLRSSGAYTITANPIYTYTGEAAATLALAHGDLQGRSQLLGAPAKIVVSSYSAPSTIVGMPPMHIDWVVPSCADPNYPNNCSTPQVVNSLAKPSTNFAQFNTEVKDSNQSSSQPTTSYSFSNQFTFGTKVSLGIPDLVSADLEDGFALGGMYSTSISTATTSYSSQEFDASVRTGFADHVWFSNYRFNIWSYPIIGKSSCPITKPNCTPDERLPLHAQFSGPDQSNSYDLDGNVVEWYQPVWEPGNVLSYPWTEAQLLAHLPRTYISNKSNVWAVDSSGSNASVTWEQGGGQNITSATSLAYNDEESVSASAGFSIKGNGISASVGITHTDDDSTQTLNSAGNTHGSSTGFAVSRTAQGVADYVYTAQTYILGQNSPPSTQQVLPLFSTVVVTGPLQLGYWANPFDPVVGGSWWGRAYGLPDVALNHPQRWTWTNSPSDPNLMTFNAPVTSTSPFDQEFYMLRGLLVTPAGSPNGTQATTAAVNDTVLLQARVYNYSHLDMNDPGLAQQAAKVRVRFYGQLFRSDSGEYPVGESFLIGERELGPLPGFASDTTPGNIPNWTVAVQEFSPQNFTQTQNGDVYVRFWVVVWMEDAGGNLVAEMAGHGIEANPRLETITTMGDIQTEPYSNNVGSLKQIFYVQPANSDGAAGERTAPAPSAAAALSLTLDTLQIVAPVPPPTASGLRGKHQVSVTLRNGPAAGPLVLVYYDGDPEAGGRAFEWEMIPHLKAGAQYVNRVTYTPQACGERTIYVVAQMGGEEFIGTTTVENVPCTVILPIIGKR
jgi:hypothetical protein